MKSMQKILYFIMFIMISGLVSCASYIAMNDTIFYEEYDVPYDITVEKKTHYPITYKVKFVEREIERELLSTEFDGFTSYYIVPERYYFMESKRYYIPPYSHYQYHNH